MNDIQGWTTSHGQGVFQESSVLSKPFYNAFALAFLFQGQSFEMPSTSLFTINFVPLRNAKVEPNPTQTNQKFTVSFDTFNLIPILEHGHVGAHTRINNKDLQEGHTEYFGLGWRTLKYDFMTANEPGIMEIAIEYRKMSSLFLYSGTSVSLVKNFRIKKGNLRTQPQQHFTEFISF